MNQLIPYRTIIATALFLPLVSLINRPSVNGAAEKALPAQGWVSLFDGKTTNGWHIYGKPGKATGWMVEDNSLRPDTSIPKAERGDLVTDGEFENYHLKLEWKVAPRSNSGIIFNVKEDPAKYPHAYNTGPEMQVLDNDRHPDAKIHKHRSGDLYDLIASSKEVTKPVGQWNKVDIIINKGKLSFSLNGVNIVATTMFDDGWKAMIAGSKFATMKDFGTFRSGKIALQDHGDIVWYRNIRIKNL